MSATIRSVEAFAFRVPLATPVETSFGRMTDRPAVFVRVEDEDAIAGFGEAWCNFPSVGAEHRVRLIRDILAPLAIGRRIDEPGSLFDHLTAKTAVLAVQSGEHGPLAQAIAGIDTAVWDLHARRAGLPLWRMLGGTPAAGGEGAAIPVYASGINPTGSGEMAARALKAGHRAFKLKVGFGADRDRANLHEIRREIGDLPLAVDANQAWNPAEATEAAPRLAEFGLAWLEEPIRADHPWDAWRSVKAASPVPLAGGENIAGEAAFAAAFEAGILAVIQPDLAKWGGLTASSRVARAALAAGRRFCPHYLGGGIGLLASAHLLAGIGGDGLLEIDVNPNPLRDLACGPVAAVSEGRVTLGDEPGLGIVPDLDAFATWRTL
ncbi:mandelate racemase/muconate lactonizing enzyme family protein [Enterovirga rhinocerotis]|uniref:L-alanine-DL-glutamate epimerase-like enolase superfamily enzyme n=1 Tax=Enterovirga rhinocerotis TaxID=1339210 RepID=A0A4V3DXL8_9HYPH|nr:mandelate racemase/muconate lactonizing enzyme family protein [Enterovirga rhinocerotis]TDR89169.1 L-alanine-DL-glutamate epimerase-like enolase superfamily enzyme [Enterovirga rhinocerotis]